ncbi:MAG: FAD-dependent oxidoreductase, partial [Gammaproteobacteria bacterium]|nr:FAD-dependent oxidoreductase [Gammaproteobacteria bacterium]
VDVGGQWVGPGQERILALLKELGIETYKQFNEGAHLLEIGGQLKQFKGSIPKIGPAALLDLQRCIWKVERTAAQMKANGGVAAISNAQYDNITLAGWLYKNTFSKSTYSLLKAAVHAVFAAEPEELSFLFFLQYVSSAGGLMPLIETENGAQDSRVAGGMGAVAEALADRAMQHGAKVVRNAPVTKVFVKQDQVRVLTSDNVYGCHRVIVAMSPRDADRIQWSPKLPTPRQRLMSDMPMGSVIKTVIFYTKPFWRTKGLSGEMVTDQAPLR